VYVTNQSFLKMWAFKYSCIAGFSKGIAKHRILSLGLVAPLVLEFIEYTVNRCIHNKTWLNDAKNYGNLSARFEE